MISKSIKSFCENPELIENYAEAVADLSNLWECHHRLELVETGALENTSRAVLIEKDLYYNRPPEELIFLRRDVHCRMHRVSRDLNPEVLKRMSEVQKGRHHSKETKRKMSESHRSYLSSHPEARKSMGERSKGNKSTTGKKWFNDGKVNKVAETCPEGFVPGRLFKEKKIIHNKGKKCFNNGEIQIYLKEDEPIPEGFVPGRIKI